MADLDDDLACLKSRYRSVCFQLSIDDQISEQAWDDYVELSERYSLEGDHLHWLCCLLYLESRSHEDPNNRPSLTGLLKSTGMEPHRFFEICKRQLSSPDVHKLEMAHQVGIVLASKFQLVFEAVFDQNFEDFTLYRDFAWLFFCWARLQTFSDPSDLVNGFHLMLACHELLFQSALSAGMLDAVHPELESSCTVDVLCQLCDRFQATASEARSLFVYGLEPAVQELHERKIVTLPLLADVVGNMRSLSSAYDLILSEEDYIDERKTDEPPTLGDLSRRASRSTLRQFLHRYPSAESQLNECLPQNWQRKLDQVLWPVYGDMADYSNGRKLTIITLAQLLRAEELANGEELEQLLFSTSLTSALFECSIRLINYWQGQRDEEWSGALVPPFYAYSVIQPVVRSLLNIGLCRDSARHLLAVEERLLESPVLRNDSPLWSRIEGEELPASAEVCCEDKETNEGGKRPQNSLTLIMSKLYLLCANRLDELCCHHLEQREIVARRCWFLLEHILREDLVFLKDRHIDQIIMCSIYAMTKVAGQPVSFQKIMKQYRKIGKAQTFKQVAMGGDEFGDIIAFYNKVFVPKYKTVICNFLRECMATGKDRDLPPLPGLNTETNMMESPLKLSPRYSVYLSPRKPSARSKYLLLYTCQTSPHTDFSKINAAMDMHALRKRTRPATVSQEELCEDGPRKKRCQESRSANRKRTSNDEHRADEAPPSKLVKR